MTLSGSRPSYRLQLSVVAAGFEEALAVADGRAAAAWTVEWAVDVALALADGAAFGVAAARRRLGWPAAWPTSGRRRGRT